MPLMEAPGPDGTQPASSRTPMDDATTGEAPLDARLDRGVPGDTSLPAPDGVPLYQRHWEPRGEPWATVLIVHGIAEHSGRYERTGRLMAEAGRDVRSFDLRGHGFSGGARVYVHRWDMYLADLESVLVPLRAMGRSLVLMGHSMGALIALDYALSKRPQPDLLVLSAVPLGANAPAWQKALAPLLSGLSPGFELANPISGDQLSHDPAVGTAYFADPLVRPRTTARLGAELFGAMKRIRGSVGRLALPTLVIHGAEDSLVPAHFSEPLGGLAGVERLVLPGLRHETLNEPEGPDVVAYIVGWIEDRVKPTRAADVTTRERAGAVRGLGSSPGAGR